MVLELKETNQAYWQQLQSGAIQPTVFWEEHRNHFQVHGKFQANYFAHEKTFNYNVSPLQR